MRYKDLKMPAKNVISKIIDQPEKIKECINLCLILLGQHQQLDKEFPTVRVKVD